MSGIMYLITPSGLRKQYPRGTYTAFKNAVVRSSESQGEVVRYFTDGTLFDGLDSMMTEVGKNGSSFVISLLDGELEVDLDDKGKTEALINHHPRSRFGFGVLTTTAEGANTLDWLARLAEENTQVFTFTGHAGSIDANMIEETIQREAAAFAAQIGGQTVVADCDSTLTGHNSIRIWGHEIPQP